MKLVLSRIRLVSKTVKLALIFCTCFGFPFAITAAERAVSIIRIPITIKLDSAESRINDEIPKVIERIHQSGVTCAKAEWLKTKGLPKCNLRGLKIYCKDTWIKTKVTPELKCDISGTVARSGPILISGSGDQLFVDLPLTARVTAQGRGEIGRNIRETAEAAANIRMSLKTSISSDWNIEGKADINYSWTKRPEIRLFDTIPITIGGHVEPAVDRALDNFAREIEGTLASFEQDGKDLRSIAKMAWSDTKAPHRLSTDPDMYLMLNPDSVTYSGLLVSGDNLETTLQITGFAVVTDNPIREATENSELPPLAFKPLDDDRSIVNFDLRVLYDTLEEQFNRMVNSSGWTNLAGGRLPGKVRYSNIVIQPLQERLSIESDIEFDDGIGFFDSFRFKDMFNANGRFAFIGTPEFNAQENQIQFGDLRVEPIVNNEGSKINEVLKAVLMSDLALEAIKNALTFDLDDQLSKYKEDLRKTESDDSTIKLFADMDSISADSPKVTPDSLAISISIVGRTRLEVSF